LVSVIVTKTICQHSQPLPEDTMKFLRGIAEDYAKVKNAVYERYSGIRSLDRLNHIFDIRKEMNDCGLRQQLNLPIAYYKLAVTDAVTNIKSMWSGLKNRIREVIRTKENLSDDDRMYIRTVLKMDKTLWAILNRRKYDMPRNVVGVELDTNRLNALICRLVRKYLAKPKVSRKNNFKVIPNGYKYKDGGIYLASRVRLHRIYIPLKDNQISARQIKICILDNSIDIHIPIDVEVCESEYFKGTIYAHIGYLDAITLSNGHVYGKGLYLLVNPEVERLNNKNSERNKLRVVYKKAVASKDRQKATKIEENNLGKKKYILQKKRSRERIQNYINSEINRMFAEEKPGLIVITKPMQSRLKYFVKEYNRNISGGYNGYIRRRLKEKCDLFGVKLVAVSAKDTANVCSNCNAVGIRDKGEFHCRDCGYVSTTSLNTAKNIEKKAIAAGVKI